jgi:Zn-dependent protease
MDFSGALTPESIRWILIGVFTLLVSVAFHEFGHAAMATWLGDDTPRRQGRVTLNPLAHADPIGTLLLPLLGGAMTHGGGGGFGWGKPVQWQPSRIDRKWRMATATVLVAVAGPAMNVVLGTLIAIVHVVLIKQHVIARTGELSVILMFAVTTNFVLFFFNLIPAPPLDGGHVLESFVPYRYRTAFEQYARFGPFIVMAVAFIPPLAKIFLVPAYFCASHLYLLLGHVLGI